MKAQDREEINQTIGETHVERAYETIITFVKRFYRERTLFTRPMLHDN